MNIIVSCHLSSILIPFFKNTACTAFQSTIEQKKIAERPFFHVTNRMHGRKKPSDWSISDCLSVLNIDQPIIA